MLSRLFDGQAVIVLGTGPSLNDQADEIRESGYPIFGVNNTFNDFDLDAWIACDPSWHHEYGQVEGDFLKYHWDAGICERYGYEHIRGEWETGRLSLDPRYISYNHCSGAQALNLAVLMGAKTVYLAGHDMHYEAPSRHYFNDLSEDLGEYPERLRKYSSFEGLINDVYIPISKQEGLPEIINLTHSSALKCFKFGAL